MTMKVALSLLLALLVVTVGAGVARAGGRIVLDRGPVVLSAERGGYIGEFAISNAGDEPLVVSRVAIRGDDEDVRSPRRVTARFTEGGATTTIAPGSSQRVTIAWMPDRDPRVRQAFGHVVVTSNDERAGEVAMGFRAQIPQPLAIVTEQALTLIVFLPVAGLPVLWVLHALGATARRARWVPVVVAALQCVLAIWIYQSFATDVGRASGNDGFQLIERAVWLRSLGVEYFVGVDGANVTMVLLAAIVSLVASVSALGAEAQPKGFYAMLLLCSAGAMGVCVALDLVLFFVAWVTMLVPLLFLVGAWGGERRAHAGAKLAVMLLAGAALLLVAILELRAHSGRGFLVDGTTTRHSFAIPELMRASLGANGASILGFPMAKVTWVLLFAGIAVLVPTFPLHTWLPDAHRAAPTAASIMLSGVVVRVAPYALLRLNVAILPGATRWASGAIVAFGVVNVAYGALCALAQKDLKRALAYASMSQAGFCLIGVGTLTPQGIAGCLVQTFTQGLVGAMLFLLAGALQARAGTTELARFGGLARPMPNFAWMLGLAAMASLGVPGLAGFWGPMLAILGAVPLHLPLALAAALASVVVFAQHASLVQRLLFGSTPAAPPRDLGARELACVAPLAVMIVLLGVWPVPLFALVSEGVRDLAALVDPAGPDQIARVTDHARALALVREASP